MNFNPSPDGELPKHEISSIQSPESPSRRDFFKKAAGAAAAVAGLTVLGKEGVESILEDPRKETQAESLEKLLAEMRKAGLDSVPTIETSANNPLLSEVGWERLEKIMHEQNVQPNSERSLSLSELERFLNSERPKKTSSTASKG